MGQMTNKPDRIIRLFYEFPQQEFTIREISKLTRTPKSTVQKYLQELRKCKLVDKKNLAVPSLLFKTKKINYYVEKIASSGMIEYLVKALNPSCIILFGSIRKGDSTSKSDIDLFIETPLKKEVKVNIFEKKLGHTVQIHSEKNIHNLSPHLFNNVVNGIKLYGSFKIK